MDELFESGSDRVPRFLTSWYGPPDRPPSISPEWTNDLPGPLRDWHLAASAHTRPITFLNVLLPPHELVRDGDLLVFWQENQGVYEWASRTDEPDPWVFERADGQRWYPTGVRLADFLLSVTVFEALFGAEHATDFSEVTDAKLAELTAGLRELPMPGPTVGAQLHAADGLLALASPSGEDTWFVLFAALEPGKLPDVNA